MIIFYQIAWIKAIHQNFQTEKQREKASKYTRKEAICCQILNLRIYDIINRRILGKVMDINKKLNKTKNEDLLFI